VTVPLAAEDRLEVAGASLEYRFTGPQPAEAPTIVMLHEGLGSAALWRELPERLSEATGVGVFAYSRAGYGRSSPVALPRPLDYMRREALTTLPAVLEAIGFRRGLLLGHSDGASIATIYAGSVQDHRVRALSLIAPHFFVEDLSIASIAAARAAYETGDLRTKLARWHDDVDGAFLGWNGAWLDPGFPAAFDLTEELAYLRVPVQIIQGADDQYGTIRQIEVAREECYCPVDVTLIDGAGHAPQRDAPEVTLGALAGFANRMLRDHGEGRPVATAGAMN
jgi:pimeloyl-ACP methyl ester carboxylesterase